MRDQTHGHQAELRRYLRQEWNGRAICMEGVQEERKKRANFKAAMRSIASIIF